MGQSWLVGIVLGLCVGAGVVLIGAVRYGLSGPLFALGLVLAIVFGGLALLAPFVSRRTGVD